MDISSRNTCKFILSDVYSIAIGDEEDPLGKLLIDTQDYDPNDKITMESFFFGYAFEMRYCVCARIKKPIDVSVEAREDKEYFDNNSRLEKHQQKIILKDYAVYIQHEKKTPDSEQCGAKKRPFLQ